MGHFRPPSWHRPAPAAKGSRAGPRQADAQGAPRHGDRAPVTHGSVAVDVSLVASPQRGLCHIDEGAEELASGKVTVTRGLTG
jgi:hypothetical protein